MSTAPFVGCLADGGGETRFRATLGPVSSLDPQRARTTSTPQPNLWYEELLVQRQLSLSGKAQKLPGEGTILSLLTCSRPRECLAAKASTLTCSTKQNMPH
jgi:hypothetical protein